MIALIANTTEQITVTTMMMVATFQTDALKLFTYVADYQIGTKIYVNSVTVPVN